MRVIEELERRLAHLETRLEEVVDAKERLERHVAAQTEELRVQRAAIARTQRVLRTRREARRPGDGARPEGLRRGRQDSPVRERLDSQLFGEEQRAEGAGELAVRRGTSAACR